MKTQLSNCRLGVATFRETKSAMSDVATVPQLFYLRGSKHR